MCLLSFISTSVLTPSKKLLWIKKKGDLEYFSFLSVEKQPLLTNLKLEKKQKPAWTALN